MAGYRVVVGGPAREGRTFEEGRVSLEAQSFVDAHGTRIVLTDVEDDVADPALQQLGHDGLTRWVPAAATSWPSKKTP